MRHHGPTVIAAQPWENLMRKPREIVYVTGLPGAGKTTLIRAFLAHYKNWLRISGGDMILRGRPPLAENERDGLRDITGYQARQNQLLIAKNFREVLEELPGDENIVFDGHCLVKTTRGELRPIPAMIAKRMGTTKVVFVYEPPEVIWERRMKDAERPGREDEDLAMIAERLRISEDISLRYARKLGVPYLRLPSPTELQFARAITL